jgi:hypothetical protein
VEKPLFRIDALKLIGLVGVILLLSACQKILNPMPPQFIPEHTALPASTNTPNPTRTVTPKSVPLKAQTGTPTLNPTETLASILIPTLGTLPANSDRQLPFPGYKQENYVDGWYNLKANWNSLWTKWQLMTAGQLGPAGSLVGTPVEGEAGIVCEEAVDGSYKGMTLCPPLDLVNGGLLLFPGTNLAPNTEYYPLLIQQSSQYARLKSVGTGTGLVLQEVDSAGKPTRYIKPENDANGKGVVWVSGEYVPRVVLPAGVHELSFEELVAKKLFGSGFEINAEYEGIPVNFTSVTSEGKLRRYHQTRGCMLNTEMAKYGYPAEDRIAKMVLLGHYIGYIREKGVSETQFTFKAYMADLNLGRNMSYTIYGVRIGQDDGYFVVDPLKPVEYVVTESMKDPNGRGTVLLNDNASRLGYMQLLGTGGLRIIELKAGSDASMLNFCMASADEMAAHFISLGAELGYFGGSGQLTWPGFRYPITKKELYDTLTDIKMYNDHNGKISWNVFAAP